MEQIDYTICIPRGTRERLLAVAQVHELDIPIGQGGPSTYHFSRERLEKAVATLQPLEHILGIQALIQELNYYHEQSRPPGDRLFPD